MKPRTTVLPVLAFAVFSVSLFFAAGSPAAGAPPEGQVARWKSRLADADEALKAGEWQRARWIADTEIKDMVRRIGRLDEATPLLSGAAFFRALAEAGLGSPREALWDFGIAQALVPAFSEVDLTSYGEAGKLLEAGRLSAMNEPEPVAEDVWEASGGYTPPRKLRARPPEHPRTKSRLCIEGSVEVLIAIAEDGSTQRPRLRSSSDPVLAFAAMDALRAWRFEPARVDGKPVTVVYTQTIDFRIPNCQGLIR